MEFVSTFLFSAAMLTCMISLLASCASCKRIFKKNKKPDEEKKQERVEVIAIDDNKKENGFNNPAYQNEANNDETKAAVKEYDVDDADKQRGREDSSGQNQVSTGVDCRIENECQNTNTSEKMVIQEEEAQQQISHSSLNQFANADDVSQTVTKISEKSCGNFNIDVMPENHNQYPSNDNNISDSDNDKNASETHNIQSKRESDLTSMDFGDMILKNGWRQDVRLQTLVEMKLIDKATTEEVRSILSTSSDGVEEHNIPESLKPYLYGDSPVAGILLSDTGEKKSIFRSAKDGILRRGTAISLLEAQAATGNIIDPVTGRKMSVSEAFQLGLLDKVYETVVSRAERAVVGYKTRISDETLSLGQAMERGLVIESHGIRLLEAQVATGGIIDHKKNIKLPLDVALEQGLVDERLAEKLKAVCEDIPDASKKDDLKTFFDPNTEENVTYLELMRRSMVDDDTGMRLYPLEKIGRKRYSYAGYSGRSSLASSRASSRESIPAALAAVP
ncbi:unnamed protein product [Clavelina lepadiformis]|uniref:Uncharacterized protein n=1 Tax=Clavelina lepadiformis TaxID=159417 RepID=A0ABP0GEJ5_CLALP